MQKNQPITIRHDMPFGTRIDADGSIAFRLWAPSARAVDLCLQEGEQEIVVPMTAEADGWYALTTRAAGVGRRYRYRIDGERHAPDPASRYQPEDVHGPSEVIDPLAFNWSDDEWRGRPWEEAVIYELHVGTFTPEGTFAGAAERLEHLAALGVTAVELMPIADFPGKRNWGYDGVLPFAPEAEYGRPEALKALVQAAHARGIMVFLDVVYNHFGPEGNYLHGYARDFFTERHHTPWGAAINFDGARSRPVRDFFIHNALYWLEEYRMDGLRLDAVHAIKDDSDPDFLTELARAVAVGPGAERHIHLVLENEDNIARRLVRDSAHKPRTYTAQWNDDIHHALHVLTTGESDGYYSDYADDPLGHLGRCLTEGFAYQGEPSRHRKGARRGEPSGGLPPGAFVTFLQSHDQVGNRAHGERIATLAPPEAVRAATAVILLAPFPPMLFMGEEWGAREPFPFYCDFGAELAQAVRDGRKREFAAFARFNGAAGSVEIPDPIAPSTYDSARLDWRALESHEGREWLTFYRTLLQLRAREIAPRLTGMPGGAARALPLGARAVQVDWRLGDGAKLTLLANLGTEPVAGVKKLGGRQLYPADGSFVALTGGVLAPWGVTWFIESAAEAADGR